MKKSIFPILALMMLSSTVSAENLNNYTPPTNVTPPVEVPETKELPNTGTDEEDKAAEEAAAKAESDKKAAAADAAAKRAAEAAERDAKMAEEEAVKEATETENAQAEAEAAEEAKKAATEIEEQMPVALTTEVPEVEIPETQVFEFYHGETSEDSIAQRTWLEGFKLMYPNAEIRETEVWNNEENKAQLAQRFADLDVEPTDTVPLNILNGEVVEGFKPEKIMSVAQKSFGKPNQAEKEELTDDELAQKAKNRKIRTFLLVSALAFMIFIWGFSGASKKEKNEKK